MFIHVFLYGIPLIFTSTITGRRIRKEYDQNVCSSAHNLRHDEIPNRVHKYHKGVLRGGAQTQPVS